MKDQLSDEPCPNCLEAWHGDWIMLEAIMPIPEGALAPRDWEGEKECWDCASARTLLKLNEVPTWGQARTVIESDRRAAWRLYPSVHKALVPMMRLGIMRSLPDYELEDHHRWQDAHVMPKLGIPMERRWFGEEKEKPDDAGPPAG